jgi:hypothetical protein
VRSIGVTLRWLMVYRLAFLAEINVESREGGKFECHSFIPTKLESTFGAVISFSSTEWPLTSDLHLFISFLLLPFMIYIEYSVALENHHPRLKKSSVLDYWYRYYKFLSSTTEFTFVFLYMTPIDYRSLIYTYHFLPADSHIPSHFPNQSLMPSPLVDIPSERSSVLDSRFRYVSKFEGATVMRLRFSFVNFAGA